MKTYIVKFESKNKKDGDACVYVEAESCFSALEQACAHFKKVFGKEGPESYGNYYRVCVSEENEEPVS